MVSENAILVVRSNTLVPSMVRIPPGSFVMGSPLTEKERNGTESPQTHVTISKEFWIGKNEVTQREYFALIGNNPSTFTGDLNRPVESLKWQEAKNYCLQLTELERVAGRVPTGYEYRLPTEAEWEYACRAGTTTRFSYGDDLDYAQLGNYAWFMVNSSNSTHGVGQKLPNPWGLYDIHGNVWEMCLDYWSLSYSGGNVTDPKGANSGIGRSARGGSYKYYGLDCRSAIRYTYYPDDRNSQVGFRVVLAPKL